VVSRAPDLATGPAMESRSLLRDCVYRIALAVLLACGAYYLGAMIYVVASRIGYPFALEWLEGGSYLQVHRILTGQPLYDQPSIDYVAMIYPPLYYYASAVISRVIGFGFLPLRLVSFVSSLGCLAVIYMICRREATEVAPAVLASTLFAAAYPLVGTWFDVARVDMLSVFLVLVSIWLLRLQKGPAYIAAGIGFALACLTKQIHLLTLVVLCIYLIVFERARAIGFVISAIASLALAYLVLNRVYAGWFSFFTLHLALGSGEYVAFEPAASLQTAWDFWANSILGALPVATLLSAVYVIWSLVRRASLRRLFFFVTCAIGMVGTSWSVIQVGGYKNDLVPAYAIIAILFGLGLQEFGFSPTRRIADRGAILVACVIQFLLLYYPVAAQLPRRDDLLAGQALVADIRAEPRAVYVPFHPELAVMAGKAAFASWSPMYQLEGNFGGGDPNQTRRVKVEFVNAMARHDFGLIILDKTPNWIWGHPEEHYAIIPAPVFSRPDVFWPVTGWQIRPEIKMIPSGR
jgi:hypothetical protein